MPEDKPTHLDLFSGIPQEASPSPHNGQDSAPSPLSKSTNTARKSSPKTLWATPRSAKIGGYSSPNFRPTLEQEVLSSATSSISTDTAGKSSPKTFWPTPQARAQTDTPAERLRHTPCLESAVISSTSTEAPTDASTSSQEDFLASLSALPGSNEARQMTVRSGRRCSALLAKQDPLGCLARTFLASSRWNSTTCYLTWKESATPRGRLLFRLVPSMPGTDETDCGSSDEGLFLMPSANEDAAGRPGAKMQKMLGNDPRIRGFFPTPQTMDQIEMVRPVVMKANSPRIVSNNGVEGQAGLRDYVATFPTPTERDYKSGRGNAERVYSELTPLIERAEPRGSLNPQFVEWLLGYPKDYTAIGNTMTNGKESQE